MFGSGRLGEDVRKTRLNSILEIKKNGEATMQHITIQGNENDIISELSQYMSPSNARIIVRNLPAFNDLLDEDETLELKRECPDSKNSMDFLIPTTKYYVNLKMTTFAFIGLLLDIEFVKGFASFVLSVFGITADAIRRLSDTEKCVLLLVKAEGVLIREDKYVLIDSALCNNYARNCECRQYNRCKLAEDMLTATVQKLLDKNIIRQTDSKLVYRF